LSPEKSRDNLARSNIFGSNPSELGCLNAGGKIQGETQLQKAETCQDENTSVLTADSRTVPSFKEPKAEVRWVQCKDEETHYFEELLVHKLTVQSKRGAK
jgi:hypothetical protein